jgi:hypothetical protein
MVYRLSIVLYRTAGSGRGLTVAVAQGHYA